MVALKMVSPSKEHLEKHYEDLSDKPFFKGLVTCKQRISEIEEQGLTALCRHAQWSDCRDGVGGP